MSRVSVVIMTRDRCASLARTLERIARNAPGSPVVVVDNGSSDGTQRMVARDFPHVRLIELPENQGATARNAGVAATRTPYVAFADDDSWWAPGALDRAAGLFDAEPRLGLVAARVLVGDDERLDPTCTVMADSAIPGRGHLPGPRVLGFIACGAVVRRSAFLEVGGFHPVVFFFGEETLLAQDLSAAGWELCYVADVVAHHHPPAGGDPLRRRRLQLRNWLLSSWLRRRPGGLLSDTLPVLTAAGDPYARGALLDAARRLPAVLAARRPLPRAVEADLRALERAGQWAVPAAPPAPGARPAGTLVTGR